MGQRAQIVHHVPGRVRIRLPREWRMPELLRRIRESLAEQPGIWRVSVSRASGSVRINYDPELLTDFDQWLAAHAVRAKLFRLEVRPQADKSGTARALASGLRQISNVFSHLTGGAADLRELFPLGLGAYAFFFINRSVGAPLWLSMLFFSFEAYMDLHGPEPKRELGPAVAALRAEIATLRAELLTRSRSSAG